MATTINAGRVAMVPKGEWSASTAYTRLDVVQYNGSSYVASQDSTGQNPSTATTYWQLLASGVNPSNYYTKTETNTKLGGKQDALVSGQNIKTVNGQSVLGDGNLELGELFVVTMTQHNSVYTADKSVSEIYAASYTNGKPVIAVMRDINNPVFILTDCDPDGDSYVFSSIESNVVTTLRWQQTDDYTYELETIVLQPHLVSGTNIKTVNNESLLGSGNVDIAGKSAYQSYVDTTTDTPVKTEAEWVASLKGADGVDLGEVAIADNLTEGGSDKVLSAEMGKVLGDVVFGSSTRTINYTDLTWTTNKGITNTGALVDASYYAYSEQFPLEAGDELTITFRGSSISLIAKYENGAYTPIVAIPPGTDTSVDHTTTHTIVESGIYVATCFKPYFSMVVVGNEKTQGLVDDVAELQALARTYNITEILPIAGGSLDLSTGKPTAPITSRNSFVRYSYMSKFIRFDADVDVLTNIAVTTGEDYWLICFDKDFAFLGYVKNSLTPTTGTKYIKIALGHPADQEVERLLQVSATYHAPHFELVKNVGNGINPYYFAYECHNVPIVGSDISGNTYNGDQTRRFDMGYVMLPPNYSVDGSPVPLVLFFHGSGMFKWKGGTATSGNLWLPIYSATAPYIDLLTFICKCGYAVADCCAMTDKYSLSGNYGYDYKCAPIGLSCYASLYNYIVDNFNIRTDGVYAFGKSAGGEPVLQLAYNKGIPVRAIANMTPALSTMGTFRYSDKAETNWLLGQFGYDNPNVQNGLVGTGDVAYVKAGIENIKGWEAFVMGTNIDLTTLANAWYKYGRLDSSMPDLQAIVDATAKYQPVPLKMWASEDDNATPYLYMEMYKKMVDNGNGICILRTMPNNTGKHMSVDGPSAIRCDYKTKYGGVVNTTVAFAEMIDWFDRW